MTNPIPAASVDGKFTGQAGSRRLASGAQEPPSGGLLPLVWPPSGHLHDTHWRSCVLARHTCALAGPKEVGVREEPAGLWCMQHWPGAAAGPQDRPGASLTEQLWSEGVLERPRHGEVPGAEAQGPAHTAEVQA